MRYNVSSLLEAEPSASWITCQGTTSIVLSCSPQFVIPSEARRSSATEREPRDLVVLTKQKQDSSHRPHSQCSLGPARNDKCREDCLARLKSCPDTLRKTKRAWLPQVAIFLLVFAIALPALAQDWIRTGTGLGVEKVRLAVPGFKVATADASNAKFQQVFDDVLWNDLANAGIFDMVSRSFYPLQTPGTPQELNITSWGNPPPNASMVAFGNL